MWTLAAIGLFTIVAAGKCALAECLSSAAEVRATHGVGAWSTWRNLGGRRCYMLGQRKAHEAQAAEQRYSKAKVAGSTPAVGAIIPLPRFFADQVPSPARYKPTDEGSRLAGVMETTVDRVHRRLLEVGFDERFRAAYEK